jgi:serralysin
MTTFNFTPANSINAPFDNGLEIFGINVVNLTSGAYIVATQVHGIVNTGQFSLTNAGFISGGSSGVVVFPDTGPSGKSQFSNSASGVISGSLFGLFLSGGTTSSFTVANSGLISAIDEAAIVVFNGASFSLNNSGELASGGFAVDLRTDAGTSTITNTGSMTGGIINVSASAMTVVNAGTIQGNILHNSGASALAADTFRMTSGLITGVVSLGGGSNVVMVTGGTINGPINTGANVDTIDILGGVVGGLSVGGGNDVVSTVGGTVRGTIFLDSGDDEFTGGSAAETLQGGTGDDTIVFGGGNDRYLAASTGTAAGDGFDVIDGGDGIDTYSALQVPFVAAGGLTIDLAEGVASGTGWDVDLLTGFENVLGSGENDTITGSTGDNLLSGNGGNDTMNGAQGNDRITGGFGLDRIAGGAGRDVMTGGISTNLPDGQADIFDFNATTESANSALRDVIRDFEAGIDKIDLVTIDADTVLAGNSAFAFIGTAAFSNTAGQVRYQQTAGSTLITADTNGDSVADFSVLLVGLKTLTATDFLL